VSSGEVVFYIGARKRRKGEGHTKERRGRNRDIIQRKKKIPEIVLKTEGGKSSKTCFVSRGKEERGFIFARRRGGGGGGGAGL